MRLPAMLDMRTFAHFLGLLICLVDIVIATNIATFQDTECKRSSNNINGPNGYPDGTCTQFSLGAAQSFQVVDLDPGCGVTIYGNNSNELVCSSEVLQIAELGKCYNTTWMYYSIDSCQNPSTLPSATPSSSASPSGPHSSGKTATIAGAVAGTIFGLIVICVGIFLVIRRWNSERRAANEGREQSNPSELDAGGAAVVEIDRNSKWAMRVGVRNGPVHELADQNERAEMVRLSHCDGFVFELPATEVSELAGSEEGAAQKGKSEKVNIMWV